MREINQPEQGYDEINERRALWVAIIYTIVAASSVGLAFVLIARNPVWQVFLMAATTVVSLVCDLVAVILILRGRTPLALKILYWSGLFSLPLNTLIFTGVASFLAAITLAVGFINVFYLFPKSWRLRYQFGPIIAAVAIYIVEFIDPAFRINMGGTSGPFGWIVFFFIVVSTFGIIALQLWRSNRLRNRIIVLLIGGLTPILVISTFFTIQSQRNDLENLLLDRAESNAITGAAVIGHLFEDAIESETLTKEEVFDTDYIKFFEFDPSMDPNFDPDTDGDPSSFDKYHTAYDIYTDEHWQELIDSYLTHEDILFAVPVDRNGYLPTHNTRYTTGDGSIATDRTKRIFNDPVGLAAAENTKPTLQQIYPRPGTGEILWDFSAPIYVDGEHWGAFRVGIQLGGNQERVIATTTRSVVASTITVAVLIGLAWFLGFYISNPIESLTVAATKATEGDLNQQIEITDRAEITTLAQAFSAMIAQLRELVTSLEQRVVERTRALETSTEVGRRLSTILDQRELVREVVEQVQKAFNYYHAQIYLFDENKENLIMAGGTGEVGQTMLEQGHSIPKGRGLVGRAAEINLPILVPSVERSIGYEIITTETVEEVFERESNLASTKTWYANHISANFTDIQVFAERVAQKKATGDQLPRIGYVLYGLNDFLETMKMGAEEAAQSLGLEVEIFSADFDPDRGVRRFREMIAERKDGLIVTPHFPEKWVEPIQEAVEAGIPVLTANLRCPDSASLAWFGQNSYQSGLILSRELQKVLAAAGKTSGKIVVASAREIHELHERYAGLRRGLEGTAYTLTEFYDVAQEEVQNQKDWEQLVVKHSDMIAAVGLASMDLPSLIQIKKRLNAPWIAAGYDLTVEILEAILDGTAQVTIGQHPYMQGFLPVLALAEHLVDRKPLRNWIVESWQANPLLPETRGEVAVPIAIGENVLGVLDVQDSQANKLTETDAELLQSISNQVAQALQNAQAYQQTQQQVAREALIANINQQIQSSINIEEALQITVREIGRALGTDASIQLTQKSNGNPKTRD